MAAISAAELDATWRQLERVPRPDLARALARAQELGAAAFKRKDFQGAYDHYNQAVTGLEYLARTGADATERDAVRALANRSACKLGRGDAAGAARDAAECARREPAWPKAWYRLGRALFAQDKFGDASQAFDEGARLEPDNAEFGRWRERCRAREEAAAAERRRARRARALDARHRIDAPRGSCRVLPRRRRVADHAGGVRLHPCRPPPHPRRPPSPCRLHKRLARRGGVDSDARPPLSLRVPRRGRR